MHGLEIGAQLMIRIIKLICMLCSVALYGESNIY